MRKVSSDLGLGIYKTDSTQQNHGITLGPMMNFLSTAYLGNVLKLLETYMLFSLISVKSHQDR